MAYSYIVSIFLYLSVILIVFLVIRIIKYYLTKNSRYLITTIYFSVIGIIATLIVVWFGFYSFLNGLKEYLFVYGSHADPTFMYNSLHSHFNRLYIVIMPSIVLIVIFMFAVLKSERQK